VYQHQCVESSLKERKSNHHPSNYELLRQIRYRNGRSVTKM